MPQMLLEQQKETSSWLATVAPTPVNAGPWDLVMAEKDTRAIRKSGCSITKALRPCMLDNTGYNNLAISIIYQKHVFLLFWAYCHDNFLYGPNKI